MTNSDFIPNHYIIVLKRDLSRDAAGAHVERISSAFTVRAAQRDLGQIAGVKHRYEIGQFRGYSGSFDEETLDEIRNSDEVAYVEQDSYVDTQDDEVTTQENVPSWGLARICRDKAVDGATTYAYSEDSSGQNTFAYVIDTGIYIEHDEFNNGDVCRARWGATILSGAKNTDTDGHGTHVAGTIAGSTCGVAKQTQVIAVKVFPDATEEEKKNNVQVRSSTSNSMKGLEWSVHDAKQNIRRSVANMSLGSAKSHAKNEIVRAAVNAGLVVVVASGNQTTDASERSPASAPEAIAVGATTEDDKTRKTSNYGKCVDILAPGDKITSAGIKSHNDYVKKSGTSMASPHVAGVACCILSSKNPPPVPGVASECVTIEKLVLTGGDGVRITSQMDILNLNDFTQSPASVTQRLKKMAGRDEITLEKQKDTLNLMLNNGKHIK